MELYIEVIHISMYMRSRTSMYRSEKMRQRANCRCSPCTGNPIHSFIISISYLSHSFSFFTLSLCFFLYTNIHTIVMYTNYYIVISKNCSICFYHHHHHHQQYYYDYYNCIYLSIYIVNTITNTRILEQYDCVMWCTLYSRTISRSVWG